ncbi:MAG: tetratricopeptide repeat protein [Candidatus Roizmanbacteria bacterium]|nr:tetratricopeptide repeat protein [Candidatus Roizmanbacteria bacterium]
MKKILVIVVLGFLIYCLSLSNGFVWDDEVMFQKAGSIPNTVYFRPAISAVYSTIYNVFGPRPFFFHFFQLIFHIGTAILIYYLFRRFFKETISLILALIFLVHPANVEAVSFASAMQEVAFTLTGIIGLYLFVSSENLSIAKVFSATFLLLIALLMKETAIVFFVLVFCYLVLFKRKQNNVLVSYSIFAVILLMVYLLVRFSSGNTYVQGQGLFPIMRVSLATRLINIPSIILYYLSKFFYPINLAIAQHWVIKSPSFINFFLPLILEILLFLSAVIYSIKKKDKTFVFFFLWFLVGLVPHLQIIPLNMTVAERWLYFPMIGLLGMIGIIASKIKNGQIILIMVIILFSLRTFFRTLDWRNGLTLYSHDIKDTSSFDLQNNMGVELFRIGKFNQAKKYFEISTKLAPYWWVNWNNLGAIYEREKNYPKAVKYYQKAIDNGQYYLAYENLAKILVLHGNNQKKTEDFLKKALEIFPENQNLQQISVYYLQQINQKKIKLD